jgi:hypothetical protein
MFLGEILVLRDSAMGREAEALLRLQELAIPISPRVEP